MLHDNTDKPVRVIQLYNNEYYTTRLRQVSYLAELGIMYRECDANNVFWFDKTPELLKALNDYSKEHLANVIYI